MPALENARQELFAQHVASGTTLIEAHEAAGYTPDYGNASHLTSNHNVKQRIEELQQYTCDLTQFTVASLVARADELRALAIKESQISAGVAAVKEIGILTGLRIDRREVGAPGEFERLSDDELKHFIASENAKMIELPSDE